MTVIAIVGSREFPDHRPVYHVIWALAHRGPVTVISGGARGVDRYARDACRDLRFHFCQEDPDTHGLEHLPLPHHFYEFRAKWHGEDGKGPYNPRAGFERNSEIVRHASRVVAFLAPGSPTSGTSDTIEKAKAAGLPVSVFHDGVWTHSEGVTVVRSAVHVAGTGGTVNPV